MKKPIGVTIHLDTWPREGGIQIPVFTWLMETVKALVTDLQSRVPGARQPGDYVAIKELRMDPDSGALVLEAWMKDKDHQPVECEVPEC